MRFTLFLILFSLVSRLYSQGDSVAYSKDFILYEGLYLSYTDFRHNWPISKEKIITDIDKDQLDFYTKLIEGDKIEYIERDGNKANILADKVWGFCQNNVIYINSNRSFFRIPLFGAISFFLASVDITVYSPSYNVFINGPPGNTATNAKEIRDYLMDFYTGKRVDYTLDNLEELLKRDDAIYKEFMALSRKKKKELATRFIRKYNEKHPVYFPKN
jgi:hypothetical protein